MEQYTVTGMSCAACSARVEKAVTKVPGVTSCSVSLLTNSMGVEGTAAPEEIIRAVEAAGYGAAKKQAAGAGEQKLSVSAQEDALKDRETPVLKQRLIASVGFLIVLMYLSMGHMMWGWSVPAVLDENPVAMGLTQLFLSVIIMVINQKFFISGFQSLWHRAPNMDTLVALGSGAAFVYSVYALYAMTGAQLRGDTAAVMAYMHEFYFESAAMILTLITVGKMLEARSKGRTTDALKSLMKLAPKTAVIVRDGVEIEVSIEKLKKGDCFVVRPGENIPVDGIVLEGSSAVNEAALTGESVPVDKAAGDTVSAATLNQSGFLRCEATRVGEDTTLSQIIRMVSDAAATKAPIAKVADKVSGVFVPVVIAVAVITSLVWLLVGKSVGFALARGISVLVISCPCALGLATPVAIMVGSGVGAKNGIMFKTAASLETTGRMQIVALDKTGTITSGEPKVTDILAVKLSNSGAATISSINSNQDNASESQVMESNSSAEALLTLAYQLEKRSEHPLARAIVEYGKEHVPESCSLEAELTDFAVLPGSGLQAVWHGEEICGGNAAFVSTKAEIPVDWRKRAEELAAQGKTPLFFAKAGKLLGIIAVADVIRAESPQAVKELQDMGIRVVMLTGDNERTARAIGAQAGVDDVIAGVLPEGKEQVIRDLQQQGKVAMVGDGINDAPALTRADIGIAIGAGTDIAIDAADVVLMKSRLSDVPAAIRLSRETLRNIHENLFWAFIYNIIGIPLAAGVWIHLFGWQLNPMFGAAAMSLSSFCVVTNALRLNLFRLYEPKKTKCVRVQSDSKTEKIRAEEKTPESGKQLAEGKQQTKETQPADGQKVITEAVIKEIEAAGMKAVESSIKDTTNAKNKMMEESTMNKTMKIDGMMCGHCEARVKKCLEALPEVSEAVASHTDGTAVVTLIAEIADDVLKAAVEAQDYTVLSID